MAVASTSKEKTEPSVDSFPSSPLVSKPGSDSCSETSSIGISGVVADAFDRNDQSDLSVQQRKDAEIQSAVMFRSEEYRFLFRLPPDEVLVRDFNCAFQESILLQGHMYLFARHICFYSNIFGFETKKIIPFHEVTCVRKAKTAAIFPNAIEILAGTKKYFFASFLFRDEAYRLIVDGWSQHSTGAAALIDRQDLKSELRSQGNGDVVLDKLKNCEQIPNDFDSFDRNKDAHVSGELKKQSIGEDEIVVSTGHFELLENGEDNTVPLASAECSSSGVPLKWKVEDADAPTVPEYYKKVAESRFPVEVEEFFSLFFSDDAVGFVEKFHKQCGDKEFRCTSWYEHELFGHTRDVSFQHPIKLYFGAKFGQCHEVQKFRVYRNSHLVIETSQEVNDVPYADYFCVQGLWVVEKEGAEASGGCILQVYVNVAFSKKTMWKGKIEQSTLEECRDAYSSWLNIAHDSLKQENLAKPEEAGVTNMIQNDDFYLEGNATMKEISERVHDSREVPTPHEGSAGDQSMLDKNHVQGDMIDSSSDAHSLSGSLRKFLSYLKSQNRLSLVLVIASLSILLLMQMSIIVLLTRAPQVHIISQLDYARHIGSKGGDGRTEAIAWLEKRVHNLKDEMLMVEAHLERMLHEHAMLKAQLKSLEEVRERT